MLPLQDGNSGIKLVERQAVLNRWMMLWLLAVGLCSPALAQGTDNTTAYSLTISGGASLGVYEAGLNWVLIENMRREHLADPEHFTLRAVAGASAGSINALISALRFCMAEGEDDDWQVDNNLYFRTWNQSLDKFLSSNAEDYDQLILDNGLAQKDILPDSLFARKPFAVTIDRLNKYSQQPVYREGCRVQIGMVLTRTTPLNIPVAVTPREQNVQMQRFIVPVEVSVEQNRLTLRNSRQAVVHEKDYEYLQLPERADGTLSMELVSRVAMASSAFPVAFGRVQLNYCFPRRYLIEEQAPGGSANNTTAGTTATTIVPSSPVCPAGYLLHEGFFIDGGVYDNVPLGTTVDLNMDTRKGANGGGNYIYIDPHQTRKATSGSVLNPQINMPGRASSDNGGYTLTAQLKALMPVFYGLRKQELNRTLLSDFSGRQSGVNRNLLVSLRYPPLTGYYLHYFGAFADPDFRAYDYAAGIYDGLMNSVQYYCSDHQTAAEREQKNCAGNKPEQTPVDAFVSLAGNLLGVADGQCAASGYLCYMLRAFAVQEMGAAATEDAAFNRYFPQQLPVDLSGYLILATFESLSQQGDAVMSASMDVFMAELAQQKTHCIEQGICQPLDKPLARLLRENRFSLIDTPEQFEQWSRERLRRATMRLLTIEEEQDGKMVTPLRLAALASNTYRDGSTNVWAVTSVPEAPVWYRLVPDQVGLDAAQTGFFASYLLSPSLWVFDSSQVETEVSLHRRSWGSYDDESQWFYKLQLGYRPSLNGVIYSSFGVHLNINEDLDHRSSGHEGAFGDSNRYLGWEVSTGLVGDKIRLYLGQRSFSGMPNRPDMNWTFRVSITDVASLFYLSGLR